jgi:hypothetical protein
MGFTIGSRGQVPGKEKTADKRSNDDDDEEEELCTMFCCIFAVV